MMRATRHACVARTCVSTIVVCVGFSVACARGADEARVTADLQERLNRDVKPGLFEVVTVRREGSAPLPATPGGAPRVVVYFNATLRLAQDYTFGAWDQLGPSTLAYALGATEKGLFGLRTENRAGDMVRAYGSAIYERSGEGWTPVAAVAPEASKAPNLEGSVPPSRSKQLIDQLAAMVALPPPGIPPSQDDIIAEELARASENIERRVQRREHTFTIATGPEGSDYARFGETLIAAVQAIAPNVKLRQRFSDGSVDNAWLLSRGAADYAIVQADVAAAALAASDIFARGAPLANLQAVGALFPEAIHVVVPRDSPIREIAQLRGKRVDLGAPASGTHFDAVAVLEAHGIQVADLKEAREEGLALAIARLKARELDALFATAPAPTRPLQQLAVEPGLRLLSIKGAALDRLVQMRPGLTALTLPSNTYPRQEAEVATIAAAALLVTTADAPTAEVERVTDLLYNRMPQQQGGAADVLKVSPATEFRGVTIPLHPGAARRAPDTASAPAPK